MFQPVMLHENPICLEILQNRGASPDCPIFLVDSSANVLSEARYKLRFKLRTHFLCAPATRPLKQTAGAATEHEQQVKSLNLN